MSWACRHLIIGYWTLDIDHSRKAGEFLSGRGFACNSSLRCGVFSCATYALSVVTMIITGCWITSINATKRSHHVPKSGDRDHPFVILHRKFKIHEPRSIGCYLIDDLMH